MWRKPHCDIAIFRQYSLRCLSSGYVQLLDTAKKVMQKQFLHIRFIALGCILLQPVATRAVDTCLKYHKRAEVKSVCGRIDNPLGERPDGVELILVTNSGSVLASAEADAKGRFTFAPVPKGDYLLRAKAPGYVTVERELRVTHDRDQKCEPRIEVRLGLNVCGGGTYVRGFDKKSDLLRESSGCKSGVSTQNRICECNGDFSTAT